MVDRTFRNAEPDHPCPVCGKEDWCNVSSDGQTVFCGRVENATGRTDADGKWLHRLQTSFDDLAEHLQQNSEESLAELSNSLGVSPDSLVRLRVGANGKNGWSFPERNAAGIVVGINDRSRDGRKKVRRGHKRGLYFADELLGESDTVVIVEGGSDTAAGLDMELSVVGRPSASGGVSHLTELLGGANDRKIIVLGENDKKPNGDWPGLRGAKNVAQRLATALGRPVEWTLPPDDEKDLRSWKSRQPDGVCLQTLGRHFLTDIRPTVVQPGEQDTRPEVLVTLQERNVSDHVVDQLARLGTLYEFNGKLVQIHDGVIYSVGLASLRELITATVKLCNEDDGAPCRPPKWLYESIVSRPRWPQLPSLRGVVTSPVLRPDGTILQEPGHDPVSELYADLNSSFGEIPDQPSQQQISDAVSVLLDVVSDFPFQSDEHKAAWLASLLTPLAREAYSGCTGPLFLFDANVRGSGKSLLADIVAIIVTGRDATRFTCPRCDDETRKSITAMVDAANRVILIDNIAGRFGGPAMDAALTGETWQARRLGHTELVEAPLTMTWLASGNNVVLQADTARRVCHIRLRSPLENPEDRDGFKYPDIRKHVRKHRPELLTAALTILRGYIAAGRPNQKLKPWGSFEGWSDLVRSSVVFAGLADPGMTRTELRATADSEAGNLQQMIQAMKQADPEGHGLSTSDLVKVAKGHQPSFSEVDGRELKEAMESVCGRDISQVTSRALGNRLRQFKQRVIDGLYLDVRVCRGTNLWSVATAKSGGCGGSGGCATPNLKRGRTNRSVEESLLGGGGETSTTCSTSTTEDLEWAGDAFS